MKVLLNSDIFPIIRVGMYESYLDPRYMFDDYQFENDFKDGYIHYDKDFFWEKFDDELYKKHIEKLAKDHLDGKHSENGIDITIQTGAIYSPKYYNFTTDHIDLTVTFNKRKVAKYAKDNANEFNSFLNEKYSSRSGFISFIPNNYHDWLIEFNSEDNVLASGAVLSFVFREKTTETEFDEFEQYVFENTHYSEFAATADVDFQVAKLETFIQENYIQIDVDSLNEIDIESFIDTEIIGFETCIRLAKAQFQKISDQSLSLF